MKINYKNTALSFLENPKDFAMHTPEAYEGKIYNGEGHKTADDLRLMYSLQETFSNNLFASCFNDVKYVTKPFIEAYYKSRDKLKEIVLNTPIDDAGTLIIPWPNHTQTIFYRIKNSGDGGTKDLEAFIVMFTKTPQSDSFGLDIAFYLDIENKEGMDYIWKGFTDQGRDITWWIADLMLFKTFLQYAEVETKVINAQKKDHHIGFKYLNETNKNVEILDSTYFTTISRTEGFGVRGHFRFQAYGPGLQQKKLIWISAFQKEGYTKRAKIIREAE